MAGIDEYEPEADAQTAHEIQVKAEALRKAQRVLLETRKGAYVRVFEHGTPSKEDRTIVKADLQQFCRYNMSAFHENDRKHCMLTGRQETYLRIFDFTQLSVDALLEKYTKLPEVS